MPEPCECCGDSGVLNIEFVVDMETGVRYDSPYASACHACPAGRLWLEIGLG